MEYFLCVLECVVQHISFSLLITCNGVVIVCWTVFVFCCMAAVS
uniref:Uncharacterized protein n=1 Tax=Rhizophora mucronata TaxID=61149 RepID=A0A2P2P9M8_RHIMU